MHRVQYHMPIVIVTGECFDDLKMRKFCFLKSATLAELLARSQTYQTPLIMGTILLNLSVLLLE